MILRPFAALALLSLLPFTLALSPTAIPPDTPISSLLSSAKQLLAQGDSGSALTYYDAAIARDPSSYLTIFQRGATYLSLGRANKAAADFDAALALKPDFEGALVQRARLRAKEADWDSARRDFARAGKEGGEEWADLVAAEAAFARAFDSARAGDRDRCVEHAGAAILVASAHVALRQLRAGCRFDRGEIVEGVADLQHVLQLSRADTRPHLQISAMTFYALADRERGLGQLTRCLQSDPDSRDCARLRKMEKAVDKSWKKLAGLLEKRQFNSAVKIIVGEEGTEGLLETVRAEVKSAREEGIIHEKAPDGLVDDLVEKACDCYVQMSNKKRAGPFCAEALAANPHSLPALIHKAQQQMDADEFEPAIGTLNLAKEQHPGAPRIQDLLQKAHTLLKRAKQKDYYKVLGVGRDADARTIKKAYRSAVRESHPDKAGAKGASTAAAERKIIAINEAYEVLADPDKKAQFDAGDDPNDPQRQANPFQGSPFGHGAGGQPIFFQSGGGAGNPFGGGAGGGGFSFKFGGM